MSRNTDPAAAGTAEVRPAKRSTVSAVVDNAMYTIGLMRVCGGVEDSAAVDRGGTGKIHRRADNRADATTDHFRLWMKHGADSPETRAAVAKVARMHEHYAQSYSMSNETFVRGIALFATIFDEVTQTVGLNMVTEKRKAALVTHWLAIGEQLGVKDMPRTWAGMQRVNFEYEHDPRHFRATPEGRRCADSLIDQFNDRWLPRPLHPVGRAILLSLQPDHVLEAVGQKKPPAPVVGLVRRTIRLSAQAGMRAAKRRRRRSAATGR
ncbi:DUF2236 domain-containing protein [Nocardia amikacinitolerans]|uniref:DUF2236 domain-containing protein n=1 Tax=Nocardia amikacinitolerans TaxID=756689 RepID=UPI0020A39F58|nr:DUF2236 domain-containing protein [Nocardia amikacinitolerans]MCP2280996.1 hypothetical protein (DUF2236) [Nocardia amikacinitolerans]